MRGGGTREIPPFDDIEEQLGYNPARFSHTESPDGHTPLGDTSELAMAQAVIRGIDDSATIHAWREVETALGRGQNGEPRQRVINWLDQRRGVLQDTKTSPENRAHEHASTPAEATEADAADTARATPEEMPDADDAALTSEGETATGETVTATVDEPELIADPTCAACGEDLNPKKIAGQLDYWCPLCCDFRKPETSSPAEATECGNPALGTDGGTTESSTTPICPDCRVELTREEARDEVAFWCSPCGGLKEPLDAATMEATA